MKYSICFSYRDREEHMKITLPRIHEFFTNLDEEFEIVIAEQNDGEKFRRANLLNEAARVASGEVLIFHDIDFYPVMSTYWDNESDVYLPIYNFEFRNNNLTRRPLEDIPDGWHHPQKDKEHFVTVDYRYFGGILSITKNAFFNINGYCPYFVGWGHEDDDLRNRILYHNLKVTRSTESMFYVLNHPDNRPHKDDADLKNNYIICSHGSKQQRFFWKGVSNQLSSVNEIAPKHSLVNKWIQATGFEAAPIVA